MKCQTLGERVLVSGLGIHNERTLAQLHECTRIPKELLFRVCQELIDSGKLEHFYRVGSPRKGRRIADFKSLSEIPFILEDDWSLFKPKPFQIDKEKYVQEVYRKV